MGLGGRVEGGVGRGPASKDPRTSDGTKNLLFPLVLVALMSAQSDNTALGLSANKDLARADAQ